MDKRRATWTREELGGQEKSYVDKRRARWAREELEVDKRKKWLVLVSVYGGK